MNLLTIAAYQFIKIEDPYSLRDQVKQTCSQLKLKGTVLFATEGINCFVAGESNAIRQFKEYLEVKLGFNHLCYKEHTCTKIPFTRLLVKVKKEIIAIGDPEIQPNQRTAPYLSSHDLKKWLDENRDFVLLDTRNDYEVSVGTFEKASHLNISTFRQFPKAMQNLPKDLKDKPIVMFCTGGIRCEKASSLFLREGFKNVYQLEGGILKYFEDCQSAHYQGNCFVFDWRLAVNSDLQAVERSPSEPVNSGHHRLKNPSSGDQN